MGSAAFDRELQVNPRMQIGVTGPILWRERQTRISLLGTIAAETTLFM